MTRPPVSVVMPFAGSLAEAEAALAALLALHVGPGDELILADNAGVAPAAAGVRIVTVTAERSPAHARNAGARHAHGDWILFLDADTEAPADLLDRYFAAPVGGDVGALAGAVVPAPGATSLAARYGAAKGFLSQDAHLAHPYLPRAVAANLLVRRAAFEQLGGFLEGVRAAEDTDFSWRLQRAGWLLQGRPQAPVAHRYRSTVRGLARQWRGYAAGRAWLSRRYEDFAPEPALRRAARRAVRRRPPAGGTDTNRLPAGDADTNPAAAPAVAVGPATRASYAALDALLGVQELAGLTLSNRPRRPRRPHRPHRPHRPRRPRRAPAAGQVRVVLVADRFPARGDPLADFALTLADARVEASARPEAPASAVARGLAIDYREDDGLLARAAGLVALLIRHPLRCVRDVLQRRAGEPGLAAIAPAVARLRRDRHARVHPLGAAGSPALAARLAALSGHRVES